MHTICSLNFYHTVLLSIHSIFLKGKKSKKKMLDLVINEHMMSISLFHNELNKFNNTGALMLDETETAFKLLFKHLQKNVCNIIVKPLFRGYSKRRQKCFSRPIIT